jgi:hypothetical protein
MKESFCAQNSFWRSAIIPTMSLLWKKYVTLGHYIPSSSIINGMIRKKGFHLAGFWGDEEKLWRSKFILEVSHYSYNEFALEKICHSGALYPSSIINSKSWKKMYPFGRFLRR